MERIYAFSPLGPPLIGAHSHQTPMHNRRRSSTVAGLDVEEFRQSKARRQSIINSMTKLEQGVEKAIMSSTSSDLGRYDSKLSTIQQASRLLCLPAELRNKIYTHLFESDPPLIKPTYTLPGILKTCRQIFHEAVGLYYSATPFRCLDESSTVSWLTTLPQKYLDLISEVRYDTRWIMFITPLIPVPGAEGWLFRQLVEKLEMRERGLEVVNGLLGVRDEEDGGWREGRLKVSFYSKRMASTENGILWTDKPGLGESVTANEDV
ncbi:hypothetical protein AC579_5388 [Pseudocercospora musae]|uniref:F-box domain-containing protein n=1 Tax=Pseudocercospora musae TaxID=113226 RepID=A0A139IE23_9PEZI|nr:hypothetical protein AC579_5388 [Pseudocercospora musae]